MSERKIVKLGLGLLFAALAASLVHPWIGPALVLVVVALLLGALAESAQMRKVRGRG
ncbi:putative membrane protein YccC [Crossiella equi]|uniref:Membrane protein YccC n=1 Tax=Crossiella equi TaxID=130796 RepID=A0ABS5AE80_9PSEU|nr:hypothetical protein [Crossiella equi]MBP2474010.1 putative membrane protein YccC [Crossiella equi]